MARRPHIIVINPDQMRADALSHLGNPAAKTPNLDAFAREDAVSFRRAFCQNPVCVPSRCSLFTGLYPHVLGHRTMSHLLRPGETSLLQELKQSGYYVWMNDRNDLTAGQIDGWTESHVNEVFYGGAVSAPGPENPEIRGSRGNKQYYSHYQGRLALDENGRNYTRDDASVDAAIQCIQEHHADGPVCLFLGLFYPHVPYRVEEPYYSAICRSRLPRRIRAEECRGKPRIQELIRENLGMEEYTESDWDELRAVYLGMCMKVDAQFGRIVAALKEMGIYDDCAIFFFSDHGDFTGNYDLPEKCQNSFEDSLTNVPLLIKPPKEIPADPGISNSLVELVDFYATAMDLAGVIPSHTHFGRSLREVLQNRQTPVRQYVFCEGGRQPEEKHCDMFHTYGPSGPPTTLAEWPKMLAQADDLAHAKGTMLRGERYKYISRTLGQDELYDLQQDPGETQNRIDDPALQPVVHNLRNEMLKWLQATADIVPYEYDSRWTKQMIWETIRRNVSADEVREVENLFAQGRQMEAFRKYRKK